MKTGTSSACSGEGMDVLHRDDHQWRLRVQTLDDLWVLHRLVRGGMSLGMLGERRDQTTGGDEGGRSKQAERKKMWLQLKVEHSEYVSFSDQLRVHGIIEEAPMDIGLHHTHIVNPRDEVVLISPTGFPPVDQSLLNESVQASGQGQVALLVVENDEVILYFITARGLRESATWTMRGGGKRGDLRLTEGIAADFRATIVSGLVQQLDAAMPVVVCGPGRARDRMLEDLKATSLSGTMLSVATSMGGRGAANEVLREGLAGDVLDQHRMVQEIQHLEEAWRRLSTNGAVAYGEDMVLRATQEGAVDRLLIAADLLRDETAQCAGTTWNDVVTLVESFSGEVVQCSTDHDDGEQLLGFGGAVALLRYRM